MANNKHWLIFDDEGNIVRMVQCREELIAANAIGLNYLEHEAVSGESYHIVNGQVVQKPDVLIAAEQTARDQTAATARAEEVGELQAKCAAVKAKYPEVIDLLVNLGILPEELARK